MSGIEDLFDLTVASHAEEFPEIELLPVRLAKACVAVLPVGGAGLSALADPNLRLPIGSSDDTAAFVERLQFTHAEGPCLRAYASGRPVLVTSAVIERLWPDLHYDLTVATPFRAIAALPLHDRNTRIGALDLYLGLLNVHLQMTAPDALALLRARAYATQRLVDDVAHDVVTQRIPIAELRP